MKSTGVQTEGEPCGQCGVRSVHEKKPQQGMVSQVANYFNPFSTKTDGDQTGAHSKGAPTSQPTSPGRDSARLGPSAGHARQSSWRNAFSACIESRKKTDEDEMIIETEANGPVRGFGSRRSSSNFPPPGREASYTLQGAAPSSGAAVCRAETAGSEEFVDAIEEEDEADVSERTRQLQEAIAKQGMRRASRFASADCWYDTRLVRNPPVVRESDYIGDFYIRLSPNVPSLQPRGAMVKVNLDGGDHALNFETDWFRGRMCFRLKGAPGQPETDYFKGRRRLFSLQVLGKFKEHPGDINDVVAGARFTKKFNLPFFANTIINFVKSKDKGLDLQLFGEKPYALGPLISNAMRFNEYDLTEDGGLPWWPWGGDKVLLEKGTSDEKTSSKRADFRKAKIKEWLEQTGWGGWRTDKAYCIDNFNSYLDWNKCRVSLGTSFITWGIGGYFQDNPVTLTCCNKNDMNKIYYAFEIGYRSGFTS
uniref:Domain of unknown function at the cortex 1 domain-containing protein n=1 Tax=Chromera velia CCMP2878 TaxID=1169474 RepID=A0A0G4HVJ5_9ALVE|eukprot:Cvel_8843.t1-p1 / transcript=Cvel_8843.t1 / gene=Cvel_8843 / organism=Chromera_velia_CCMP2878 / gene_product=hypothetical protein / transcript_product=hypothetical protein / location=Cvel_scaffold496:29346-34664(-) / protein_length=477 / sequence_SO=supercontig / SO=protein_coding / is_pseudo=false